MSKWKAFELIVILTLISWGVGYWAGKRAADRYYVWTCGGR